MNITQSVFKKSLLLLFLFFILRAVILTILYVARDLPIEVDDAFVYLGLANLGFNDPDRIQATATSITEVIALTIEHDGFSPKIIRYAGWINEAPYILYAKTIGYIVNYLNIDGITVWWMQAYFTQILVGLMVVSTALIYFKNQLFLLVAAVGLGFFYLTEFVHQLTGTPYTIGAAIFVTGFAITQITARLSVINIVLACFCLIVGLHVHPGVFILAGVFIVYQAFLIFYKNEEVHKVRFIILFGSLFAVLSTELFYTNYLSMDQYLGLWTQFESTTVKSSGLVYNNLLQVVKFNFHETLSRLVDITSFSYFIPNGASVIIHLFALYSIRNIAPGLVIINIIFLGINVIGLFHLIDSHPGELIEYYGQVQIIFVTIAAVLFYQNLYLKIHPIVSKKTASGIAIVLAIGLVFPKFLLLSKEAESRMLRHGFPNEFPLIKECLALANSSTLTLGDEFTYAMVLSTELEQSAVFSNGMIEPGRRWIVPKNLPEIEYYLGKKVEGGIVKVEDTKYQLSDLLVGSRLVCSSLTAVK